MSLTMNLFVLCMHDEKLIGYSGINMMFLHSTYMNKFHLLFNIRNFFITS
jgi:hypothetical protein